MTNKSVSFSNLEEDDKLVTFLDYNDFVKKYRSLKFYCPKSYKYVCFHLLKNLKVMDTGKYIASIPTDLIFFHRFMVKYNLFIVLLMEK